MRWSDRRNPEPEPATASTLFKVTGVGIDPANPGAVAVAYVPLKRVPYVAPEGMHSEQDDGVIEPTAIFKPDTSANIRYDVMVDGEQ